MTVSSAEPLPVETKTLLPIGKDSNNGPAVDNIPTCVGAEGVPTSTTTKLLLLV